MVKGKESMSEKVHELEKMYIDDCQMVETPHGFYAALLQPCEFSFFENSDDEQEGDVCSTEKSELVAEPMPVNWLFKLWEQKGDWESFSSDDVPDLDELMLWPDQCVGVAPRCYHLGDNANITQVLHRLFPDGIPEDSTHVRVDCRSDSLELSRLAYSTTDAFADILPKVLTCITITLIFWLMILLFACWGCFRICGRRDQPIYYHPVSAAFVEPHYESKSVEKDVY